MPELNRKVLVSESQAMIGSNQGLIRVIKSDTNLEMELVLSKYLISYER